MSIIEGQFEQCLGEAVTTVTNCQEHARPYRKGFLRTDATATFSDGLADARSAIPEAFD